MEEGTVQVDLLPVDVKDGVGLSVTVNTLVILSVHEPKLATSLTLNEPVFVYSCQTLRPFPVLPSPKYHLTNTGDGDELSLKRNFLFEQPFGGKAKSAITVPIEILFVTVSLHPWS